MRVDKHLAEHFGSRTKAAEAIERGEVLISGKTVSASYDLKDNEKIEFIVPDEQFVSNGGAKLSRAIKTFKVDVNGMVFSDIGASTGGFTDCLLQNGAKKVFAVDVGESLLADKLKVDKRVIPMNNTNARYLKKSDFPEEIEGIVIDVSFISLKLILPILYDILSENGIVLALIKPQFECEDKKLLTKTGIVKDKKIRKRIVEKIYDECVFNKLYPINIVNAPLKDKKNVEYVIYLKKKTDKFADRNTISMKSDQLV